MLFETRENKQNSDTLKAKSGSLQTDIFEGGGGGVVMWGIGNGDIK